MNKPYIELRNRSSFGDIINNYFLFLKYNFKAYTSLYLKYNTISIMLTLVSSYLLVSGFMGLASKDFRFGMSNNIPTDAYFIGGVILLILVIFMTSLINYSFSSAYVSEYVGNRGNVNSAHIWKKILNNIGTIIVFIMLGAAIYVFYLVISVIVSFIPLLGMIIQYGLSFTLAAAFGLTFMSIFSENKNFSDALSEGFSFTFSNFWKVVLYGLIIGILNLMITALILSIPSFILGIYVFFSLESNQEIATSFVANMVFTFGFGAFLLAFIYTQALSQVAYGILYYNLHELKHNTYLQQKIDQIGLND